MGLSTGGLIRVGLIYRSKQKASETTDNNRQNENLYLKNEENVSYYSSIYSLKKFVRKIILLWLKKRNQRVHTGELIYGGLYERAYTWSNTSVQEKVGLSPGVYAGDLYPGGVAYRRRNAVCLF